MNTVFVTDALLRKSVVVSQSLGRRGVDVTCGSSTRFSPAFFSRFCKRRMRYAAPETHPDAFVDDLLSYLDANRHDVLLPTDDLTLKLIADHHDSFASLTSVPIPDVDLLAYGLDKARLSQVADHLDIPHPRTVYPDRADQVDRLCSTLHWPLIIKPRASSGGRGLRYVNPGESAADAWAEVDARYPLPIIQECVPAGAKFDVCVLMDRSGNAVASFVQKEIRHFPIKDGLSTMQESVWQPELVERSIALLREIGWYGLAELEFIEDPRTGEILLLELNPRFWASVQLAISCGIDFPYLLYQVALDRPVTPIHRYPVGRRCRWLLPGDMLHFLANPDRFHMQPSFFDFGRNTVYDGLYRDDPGATFGVVSSCAHYLFDREMWRLLLRGKSSGQQTVAPEPLTPIVAERGTTPESSASMITPLDEPFEDEQDRPFIQAPILSERIW